MKASKMLEIARSYIGCKEEDKSHYPIVDLYNTIEPLPLDYELKYTDPWCAAFVSVVALKAGYQEFPFECSCPRMIKKLKKMDCWEEDDAFYPHLGDLIFYDWQDRDIIDDIFQADHVGIVEKTVGRKIYVIEGNYHKSVDVRITEVDARYIRGYGVLPYEKEVEVGDIIEEGLVVYQTSHQIVTDDHGIIKVIEKKG